MNLKPVYLILRHIVLAAAIVVVSGCSFKKEPRKIPVSEEIAKTETSMKVSPSLEEILSQQDSKEAINQLSTMRLDNINEYKTSRGSLLDLAIHLEKIDLINFLVLQGATPFGISEESYKKIEHNESINQVMTHIQKDIFFNILGSFPVALSDIWEFSEGTPSFEKYDRIIRSNKLGAPGCLKYIDFLMDIKYFWKDPYAAGVYYQGTEAANVRESTIYTLKNSECAQYQKYFSLVKVTEWISNEILYQFYRNFSSLDTVNLLFAIPHPKDIRIRILNSDPGDQRHVNVDPLALVMIKRTCMDNDLFEKWRDLFESISRKDLNSSDSLVFTPQSIIDRCKKENDFCEQEVHNSDTLRFVFRALLKVDAESERFYSRYDDLLEKNQSSLDEDDKFDLEAGKLAVCRPDFNEVYRE